MQTIIITMGEADSNVSELWNSVFFQWSPRLTRSNPPFKNNLRADLHFQNEYVS